jgi:hypothetical protein
VFDVTARREISTEPRPERGGVESFDTDAALEIDATEPPNHPDYRFSWLDNMATTRNRALLRGVLHCREDSATARRLTSLLS